MDIVKDDKQTPHKDKIKKIINKFVRTERGYNEQFNNVLQRSCKDY